MTTFFNDEWEQPGRAYTPLPSRSVMDETDSDWTPGGRRQRGVVDEADQGDYTTLLEHVLPNRPKYTPTAPYSSVIRSAARTMEYRPERDGGMVRENMPDRQQGGLTEKDYVQYQQNLSNAVASGKMPMERAIGLLTRAQQAMQGPRLGQSLGETAQSVTGQTHSLISNLVRGESPQSNRAYAGSPANRPVPAERPVEQTQSTPPYGTPSRIPRTAAEAYQQAQARQAQLSERGQQALADLRSRMTERQKRSQEALASLRSRLNPPTSATSGGVMRDPGIKDGMSPLEQHARREAARLGIDPEVAVRVANTEGGFSDPTRQNMEGAPAYGPYQMYVGGPSRPGLGDEMIRLGIDPRKPENAEKAVTFALEHARKNGWGAFQGAAANGIGNWDGIDQNAAPVAQAVNSGVTVQQQQKAAKSGTSVWEIGKLTPNQLTEGMAQGLDRETALAVCGPAAAIAFARKMGRNPSLPEALDMAKKVGWTLQNGMAGPASQVQLLKNMGIPAVMEEGFPDSGKMASTVSAGNPVTVSTPGHYFVAEEYDPKSGKFNWGESARVLKASGGNSWYSLDEIKNLGMGAPRAAIYMQDQ